MLRPNNPAWSRTDWWMLGFLAVGSIGTLIAVVALSTLLAVPWWVTLPLVLAYLAWAWRPCIRWWRRHG